MVASCVAVTVCSVPASAAGVMPQSLVVGQFRDPLRLGITGDLDFAPRPAQCVEERHPAQQGTPDAGDQLDGLRHHERTDGGAEHAEHAALAAGRHGTRRRRLGIQVPVRRAELLPEDADLPVKTEDRTPDVRLAEDRRGVINEVAGGEVVGAVEDEVVAGKEFQGVGGVKPDIVQPDLHERIQGGNGVAGGLDLGPPTSATPWITWR